jgi:hypothetical protein
MGIFRPTVHVIVPIRIAPRKTAADLNDRDILVFPEDFGFARELLSFSPTPTWRLTSAARRIL